MRHGLVWLADMSIAWMMLTMMYRVAFLPQDSRASSPPRPGFTVVESSLQRLYRWPAGILKGIMFLFLSTLRRAPSHA
ncbi:hypothetical protein QBC41DRAFT_60742 [Cercophora samala]|uniref:Uncharacterized protein n=1 Tax=Cercophora samala TaxID=330535 RepID=A0AA40DEH0_9PEZI|nr:hypothetical protein QBC41DRAFT_60742 [Cercophora samala]